MWWGSPGSFTLFFWMVWWYCRVGVGSDLQLAPVSPCAFINKVYRLPLSFFPPKNGFIEYYSCHGKIWFTEYCALPYTIQCWLHLVIDLDFLGFKGISLVVFLHRCCSTILQCSTPCMCTLVLSPNGLYNIISYGPMWLMLFIVMECRSSGFYLLLH